MNYKRHPDLAREQWRSALSKTSDLDMKKKLATLLEKAAN